MPLIHRKKSQRSIDADIRKEREIKEYAAKMMEASMKEKLGRGNEQRVDSYDEILKAWKNQDTESLNKVLNVWKSSEKDSGLEQIKSIWKDQKPEEPKKPKIQKVKIVDPYKLRSKRKEHEKMLAMGVPGSVGRILNPDQKIPEFKKHLHPSIFGTPAETVEVEESADWDFTKKKEI